MDAIRSSEDVRRRYDYTCNLSRRGWAWEFLRRNPDFAAEAAEHSSSTQYLPCNRNIFVVHSHAVLDSARDWGLYYYPDPNKDGLSVDAFWTPDVYQRSIPLVLSAARPDHIDEIYERTTRRCNAIYVARFEDEREYMILVGKTRTVQAACSGDSFQSSDRFQLNVGISDIMDIKTRLKIIERASAIYNAAEPDVDPEWSPQTARLRDALIAIDCVEAGMTLKETAIILYGRQLAEEDWAGASRSLKDAVRRLRAKGETLRSGRYKALLAGSI